MARRTFQQIAAGIQRKPGLSSVSLGQIYDAANTASKDLGNQPWPWNYAETNVLIPPAYSIGTVNVTDQQATVTGAGTTWVTSWYGRRIRFGNSNLDYVVQSIGGAGTLTLAQPVNLGANVVNATYTMYQDTYTYPSDYILGSDVALMQPMIRNRIPKIPRYKFEIIMNSGLRSMSTNIGMFYTDHGEDLTSGTATSRLYRFRLGPPQSGASELRLCYHQMAPDLVITDMTTFPEGYDEVIELTAAAKLYDLYKMPGESTAAKELAAGKIRLLKRQVSTQTIDDVPAALDEVGNSSISQWGMMIGRVP
jgi:hypothetical protein